MYMYHHHVSGIFQRHAEAAHAFKQLEASGVPHQRMRLYENNTEIPRVSIQAQHKVVVKNMLVFGTIGCLMGMGLATLAQIVLAAIHADGLFASFNIAPIAMLGWSAALGGLVAAAIALKRVTSIAIRKKKAGFRIWSAMPLPAAKWC